MITTQRELSAAQAKQSAELIRARLDVEAIVERVISDIAREVRAMAARRGDYIRIRTTRSNKSVRISITGARAEDYRHAVESALASRAPQVTADIRTALTRST